MAYPHQKDMIKLFGFGTGATSEVILASTAAGIRARHIFQHQNYILREVSVVINASSTTAKPVFGIRKVTGPGTTTATGTEIATLTVPVTKAKGSVILRRGLDTTFVPGDHLVIRTNTAATRAITCRVQAFVEPDWEYRGNMTNVTTVTA